MLVFRPKRSGPVDGKCKEPGEISLAKSTFLSNGTVSKVVAQNTDEARPSYCQDLNALKITCQMIPHVGVQIRMCQSKNLRSRYAALNFKPTTNPTEIYLDTCDLSPLNSETPETQHNHYSGRFRRP
ncbi:hypothetical protein ACTXT7_008837 [Hymenolepis weldensis]